MLSIDSPLITMLSISSIFLKNKSVNSLVSINFSGSNSIIFTGGPRRDSREFEVSLKEYKKFSLAINTPIRKMGSAALDMAYVAAGRCDGFWQRNLNYWDIAAGIILIKEAGGFVTDFDGNENYLDNKTILATNGKINEEMIKILK